MRALFLTSLAGLVALPSQAAVLVCTPENQLSWNDRTELTPIEGDKRDTVFATQIDTTTGAYVESAKALSMTFEGTYTIVHPGDVTGPIDFFAVETRTGRLLRIAIWHAPTTFLQVDGGGFVATGTCVETP